MTNLQSRIIAAFAVIAVILGFILLSIAFFYVRHAGTDNAAVATYDLVGIVLIIGGAIASFFFARPKVK